MLGRMWVEKRMIRKMMMKMMRYTVIMIFVLLWLAFEDFEVQKGRFWGIKNVWFWGSKLRGFWRSSPRQFLKDVLSEMHGFALPAHALRGTKGGSFSFLRHVLVPWMK